jgi:hypothetical protein
MLQKYGLTLKKNLGPQFMLDQTLFNVNIPLAISNLPGPWKNAQLNVVAVVYFLDGAGETIGYGLGKGERVSRRLMLRSTMAATTAPLSFLSGCRWARLQARPAAPPWYWLSWEIKSCLSALQRVVPHPIPETAGALLVLDSRREQSSIDCRIGPCFLTDNLYRRVLCEIAAVVSFTSR